MLNFQLLLNVEDFYGVIHLELFLSEINNKETATEANSATHCLPHRIENLPQSWSFEFWSYNCIVLSVPPPGSMTSDRLFMWTGLLILFMLTVNIDDRLLPTHVDCESIVDLPLPPGIDDRWLPVHTNCKMPIVNRPPPHDRHKSWGRTFGHPLANVKFFYMIPYEVVFLVK